MRPAAAYRILIEAVSRPLHFLACIAYPYLTSNAASLCERFPQSNGSVSLAGCEAEGIDGRMTDNSLGAAMSVTLADHSSTFPL
jgi:hypothetical protein